MSNLKKKIIETVENNKNNHHLYTLIFKILTNDNDIKNYTENSNGVFFNMNIVPDKKIKELNDKIVNFINKKNHFLENENKRNEILKNMKDDIENYHKKDLDDFLKEKNNTFSTKITNDDEKDLGDFLSIENNNTELNEKKIKTITNTQHKKSVENHLKTVKFSGSRLRINKILKSCKSGRRYNKMLKCGKGEEIDTEGIYCEELQEECEIEDEEPEEYLPCENGKIDDEVEDDELFGEDDELFGEDDEDSRDLAYEEENKN